MRDMRTALALLLLALSAWPAAAGDWIKASTPRFTLYTDVDQATARRYVDTLELFDAVLRDRHGMAIGEPPRRPLPIYLLARDRDLNRVWPGVRRSVGGFYRSSLEDTYAVAVYDRRDDSSLLHEYVHHFMLAHFPSSYPGWLVEGYAEYFMTMTVEGDNFLLGNINQGRAAWLTYGDWLPYDRVLRSRAFELTRDGHIAMFYAQSWALTHYMMSDAERRRKFDAYIASVANGGDPVTEMTRVLGRTPRQLNVDVRQYLQRGFPYSRYGRGSIRTTPAQIERLPAGAGELMLMSLRILGDNGVDAPQDRTDGPVLLREARALAAAYPGTRESDLARVRVELLLGDAAEAERILTAMLAKDARDVDALVLSSQARLKAAEATDGERRTALLAEARGFAGRAYAVDPDRYQVLVAYVRGRSGAANYPTDNDLRVLRDALSLAPQVQSLRINAASALIARDKREEAAVVLRPLLNDPHGGEATTVARELLTDLGDPAAAGAPAPAASAAETATSSD